MKLKEIKKVINQLLPGRSVIEITFRGLEKFERKEISGNHQTTSLVLATTDNKLVIRGHEIPIADIVNICEEPFENDLRESPPYYNYSFFSPT